MSGTVLSTRNTQGMVNKYKLNKKYINIITKKITKQ